MPKLLLDEDRSWWRRGGFLSLSPSPGMLRLRRAFARSYRERLTSRGRFLLWALIVFALLGAETTRSQVFVLFGVAAGLLIVPLGLAFLPRPRVRILGQLPARLTARTPTQLRILVESTSPRPQPDLLFHVPGNQDGRAGLEVEPGQRHLDLARGATLEVPVIVEAARRGRHVLRGAGVAAMDPLRLVAGASVGVEEQVLLVYPRYYVLDDFPIPVGRRYQPGGIPLSSHLGDSIEFIGTRPYREGDPLRAIHWRSWARLGEPVVKEHQEEYFCRIALILDTFTSARPRPAEREGFEAAISVLASIADHFSRSEYLVDILAAGPDVYEVSAGRSLAYFENILDVLACLEPCPDPPFERIAPHLLDRLAQLTTVVAVLLDWDEPREAFLTRVRSLGTQVQAIVVRAGATTRDWRGAAAALGNVSQTEPAEVERRIAAATAAGRHGERRGG